MRSTKERFGTRPRMYGSLLAVLVIFALGTVFFPYGAGSLVAVVYGACVGGLGWLAMHLIEKPTPPTLK